MLFPALALGSLWTTVAPWALRALLVALVFACGVLWGGGRERAAGLEALTAQRLAEEKRAQASLELVRKIENGIAQRERDHAQEVATLVAQHREEAASAAVQAERRVAALRSGSVRLRVPVVPATVGCPAPGDPAASAPAGADAAASAELDGAAAARVVSITDDGDSAIRQLSALQAYASQLHTTCSKETTK